MLHFHQPVHSLAHTASKHLKYKNLDLFCWLIFCQRRHNRKSVWHNEWMTRTAQEAAGSCLKGRPTVCCSLCFSTGTAGMLSLCDRHIREVTALQTRWKSLTFPTPPCALPSSLLPSFSKQSLCREWSEAWKEGTCSASKRNRTQAYSCLRSRMQITVFHGSQ